MLRALENVPNIRGRLFVGLFFLSRSIYQNLPTFIFDAKNTEVNTKSGKRLMLGNI